MHSSESHKAQAGTSRTHLHPHSGRLAPPREPPVNRVKPSERMAKTKTKSPAKPAPAAPANLDTEVAKKFVELKTEGNQAFARGDYAKALNVYDDAIKLLPTTAPERADIYNNKAACFIGQKRYKEAVKECTSALEVAPNSVRALQRRAKAFEQQGLYKEALADNNKLQNLLQQGVFVAKATLGDDTKLVHLSLSNSYADVLAAVQQKFPSAGAFLLKYVDKNGDLITLTCKADMHTALGELVQQYQRQVQGQGAHGPKLTSFPPLKLIVQPCAEADVPKPPVAKAGGAGEEAAHMDSWVMDFAQLFVQQTGLEPDKWVKSAVEAEFAEAEKRYGEALAYSPDFFDAAANMCQLV
eukprot:XP_001702511.1 predicted protein [Chlamydomonas reinhardtii]